MRYILFFIALFIFTASSHCQSKYSEGFEAGFKNGYCHDQGMSCITPNPPNAPIPSVNESLNSYKDGYNRGFQTGLTAQKNERTTSKYRTNNRTESSNITEPAQRTRYQTAKPIFVDNKMFNPFAGVNMNNLIAVANVLKQMKASAVEYLNEGDYQAAANLGFEGLQINNSDPEFMLIIGQAYRLSGDRKNTLKWLKRASRGMNDPNLKDFVRLLENGGELFPGETEKEIASESVSNNTSRYEELATSFGKNYSEKNFKASLDIAEELVKIKPNFQAFVMQGMAHEALGYPSKAIQDYNAALLLEANPQVLFQLSNLYSEIGLYAKSLEGVEKLISSYSPEMDLDLATLYNNKAYVLLKLKRFEESLQMVNKALKLNESYWYIWDTKGEIEYLLEDYTACIDAMTKAIEIEPHHNSFYYRGLSYIASGKSQKGCMDLAKSSGMGNKMAERELKKNCQF